MQQPSTPLVGSSWQQLPDGFLALALADERSALSSRSSMSEGTPQAEGTAHSLPAAMDDEDTAPELPVLHLQARRRGCLLYGNSRVAPPAGIQCLLCAACAIN